MSWLLHRLPARCIRIRREEMPTLVPPSSSARWTHVQGVGGSLPDLAPPPSYRTRCAARGPAPQHPTAASASGELHLSPAPVVGREGFWGEARGHFVPISLVSTQATAPPGSTRAARLTCVPPLLGPCGAPVRAALLGPSAPSAPGAQTFDGPVTGTCREVEAREDGEPPLPTPVAVRSKPRC